MLNIVQYVAVTRRNVPLSTFLAFFNLRIEPAFDFFDIELRKSGRRSVRVVPFWSDLVRKPVNIFDDPSLLGAVCEREVIRTEVVVLVEITITVNLFASKYRSAKLYN